MAKSQAVAKIEEESTALVLPDFMRADAGLGMEGVDRSSMSIPRISLVHPMSNAASSGNAKAGNFFHDQLGDLGPEITVVPVYAETGWVLWDPSGENGAPLARGRKDARGVWVWDPSHTKFEVKLNNEIVVWDTKGSIVESKLTQWPKGNPPPPGKETLNFLFVVPEIGPQAFGIFTFSKTAFTIGRKFRDNIAFRTAGGPSFAVKYRIGSESTTAKNGKKINVPTFSYVGLNDDVSVYAACRELHSKVRVGGLYGVAEESHHGEGDAAGSTVDY